MKYIGTSWKMNGTLNEARSYVREFAAGLSSVNLERVQAFLIPPFVSIDMVRRAVPDKILVGAQNVHWEDNGAFTGEISAPMLTELGVGIVEIGHFERRALFNETDRTVRLKTGQTLKHGMRPLVCIGESAETRNAGEAVSFLKGQIGETLKGLSQSEVVRVMFAYEPIWAIGKNGRPATVEYIERITTEIKAILKNLHGTGNVPVLYGGSVNSSNAGDILGIACCDGLFVGRAAWTAAGFLNILRLI